jgi:DNA modification methylase
MTKQVDLFERHPEFDPAEWLSELGILPQEIAVILGTSNYEVSRWFRGLAKPSAEQVSRLRVHIATNRESTPDATVRFRSRGSRRLALRSTANQEEVFDGGPNGSPLISRLIANDYWGSSETELKTMLRANRPRRVLEPARAESTTVSAGKNTYTYDAHTYHTKVPPQGIAEILGQCLPDGGVVLDPFGGSGMTAVAARSLGLDVVLNELSPAASFISYNFCSTMSAEKLAGAAKVLLEQLRPLRHELYRTGCRECGQLAEVLYTVWSYRVQCSRCSHEFTLWDECRVYGRTVREHKLLSDFPCPCCSNPLKKSRLKRTISVPVAVGYRCCKKQQEHAPNSDDLALIAKIDGMEIPFWFPTDHLPDGVNLRQPKSHGLDQIHKFYTRRNLIAMSAIWDKISSARAEEVETSLAFCFTSLYQRVTRLSEFRFWGGSGNSARFNVPFIWNEANVFVTFERKLKNIIDHLETTASSYSGRFVLRTGSATDLSFLPDGSIDLVFTDPPFGANINYSDMNFLWEAWLGKFTDTKSEAIVNRVQGKDLNAYAELMTTSFSEAHRVLKHTGRMLVVFMNSDGKVWSALQKCIEDAGFSVSRVDIFDKQHATFKMYVSGNTAGADLILHCEKTRNETESDKPTETSSRELLDAFINERKTSIPRLHFLHVSRDEEIDFRKLYSEYLSRALLQKAPAVDFKVFRDCFLKSLEN